jgi:outer membrane protein assembly factor BamB
MPPDRDPLCETPPMMTTLRTGAVLLAAFALAGAAAAEDWPRFRGPNGAGTSDAKTVPVKWAAQDMLWKAEIPGKGHSSPVVSKGKVFLQSSSDDGKERFLVCVDATSGKIDWTKSLASKQGYTHNKNSMSSCTPAADGERVYVIFWDGELAKKDPKKKAGQVSFGRLSLAAYDYAGAEKWRQDLGTFLSQHGPGMSPVVVDDRVIISKDQDGAAELLAFDAKTGKPAWNKKRDHERACYATPFLLEKTDAGPELVVASTGGVTSYDPKNGAELWHHVWKFDRMRLRTVGSPIFHDGLIFAISGDGAGDRNMIALRPGGKDAAPELVWKKNKGTPYVPTPLAKDGLIFWVTDKENVAYCVEAKSGAEVWNERLGRGAEVSASPVMIDGKIYVIDENGTCYVYAAAKTFELLAKNELKESVFASPAVADGKLFVRGAKHLFCIGTK